MTNNITHSLGQASCTQWQSVPESESAAQDSPDACSFEWFTLPAGGTPIGPFSNIPIPAMGSIDFVNASPGANNSIEARADRIVQFILPQV